MGYQRRENFYVVGWGQKTYPTQQASSNVSMNERNLAFVLDLFSVGNKNAKPLLLHCLR